MTIQATNSTKTRTKTRRTITNTTILQQKSILRRKRSYRETRQSKRRESIPEDIVDDLAEDLNITMTMTSTKFSYNFMSPYFVHEYVKGKEIMAKIDVPVMSFSSLMYLPNKSENSLSSQIRICVSSIFANDDILLAVNKNIIIDTNIAAVFNRVVEEVEARQEFIVQGKFMGKPMRINISFKCKPSSMEYGLEVFPNNDVEYINSRSEP